MKRLTLQEARKRRQFTQVQLAQRAGIEQATISAIENGRREEPGRAIRTKLADALGMDAFLSVAGLVFEEKQP